MDNILLSNVLLLTPGGAGEFGWHAPEVLQRACGSNLPDTLSSQVKKGTFIHDERPLCRGFTDMTTTQQVGSSRTAAVRPARMAGSSSSNLYSRRESSPPTSNLRDQYACGHWWPCTVATTQPCTQRAIPPRLNGISDFTEIYWERSALANVARYRFYQRFAGVF